MYDYKRKSHNILRYKIYLKGEIKMVTGVKEIIKLLDNFYYFLTSILLIVGAYVGGNVIMDLYHNKEVPENKYQFFGILIIYMLITLFMASLGNTANESEKVYYEVSNAKKEEREKNFSYGYQFKCYYDEDINKWVAIGIKKKRFGKDELLDKKIW